MNNKFHNAMCGKSEDYKFWQDYYEVGDFEGVYNNWLKLAKEEEELNPERMFWRAIIEIIKYKSSDKK